MVPRQVILAAFAVLSIASGCAEPEPVAGETVDNYTEKNIEFRLWDEPIELTPSRVEEAAVAYGECESVAPTEEDVDIQINCGPAWTDVAWYRISAETIEALAPTGNLGVALAIPNTHDRLRGSIHRVVADGDTQRTVKLTSTSMLFDGDILEAPIDEIADHFVYLARGRDLINVWGTGEVAFSVALSR